MGGTWARRGEGVTEDPVYHWTNGGGGGTGHKKGIIYYVDRRLIDLSAVRYAHM